MQYLVKMPQEILYSKTDNWTFLQSDSKYVTFFFAAASAFFFSAQLVFSFPQCKIILIGNSCLEYICNVWIIQRNWFISTIIGVNLIHFNMHKINLQLTSWSYILKASLATPTIPQKKLNFPQICTKMPQNGPKMAKDDPKWPKMTKKYQKWS